MRYTHKQVNPDMINMRLAAASNKMLNKRHFTRMIRESFREALEDYNHVATGSLKRSIKASSVTRKFMKQMNSATNTYTTYLNLLDYGEKLSDGFTVDTDFNTHYAAIKRWARAKAGVPKESSFAYFVAKKHIEDNVVIGATDWLGLSGTNPRGGLSRFFNKADKEIVHPDPLGDKAVQFIFDEIERIFPKEIGIRK